MLLMIYLKLDRQEISQASSGIQDINIKQIAGYNLYEKILRVKE